MNILLFSDASVLYEDSEKSAIIGMLIPRYSKIKRYADIISPNDSTVKLRHGDADDLPVFWREDGPYVFVYGNTSLDMDEKRSTQSMYLPQDFVGDNVGAFYYVIGEKYVVHGVKSITDDGQKVWGTSFIGGGDETALDTVVSSISERMLEGKEEKIIVAVHNNDDLMSVLKESLLPFEQDVIPFEDLGTPDKSVKPLYARKDRSLIMLVLSLCAFLVLSGMLFFWATGQVNLAAETTKVEKLQDILRKMQKNKNLGHIKNPRDILKVMDETLPLPPSTLVHNSGKVGAMFGEVRTIVVGSKSKRSKKRSRNVIKVDKSIYSVVVKVITNENSLLLDQERIAKKIVDTMSWVKYIELPSGTGEKEFKIGIKVK